MKAPIFVRSFSEKEREILKASLRSKETFTLRRSQMLLASSRGEEVPQIATSLGCGQQTVRDAIHETSPSTRLQRKGRGRSDGQILAPPANP